MSGDPWAVDPRRRVEIHGGRLRRWRHTYRSLSRSERRVLQLVPMVFLAGFLAVGAFMAGDWLPGVVLVAVAVAVFYRAGVHGSAVRVAYGAGESDERE